MDNRKLTHDQMKESFPGIEKITDTDVKPIIQKTEALKIVEKIGSHNITVEGENLKIATTPWVKENADLIRANKAGIIACMAELKARLAKKAEEIQARWVAKQAEQDAIDKPLIEAMHVRAAELRAQIPADHVEITVKQTGDLDGDPIMEYKAGEIKINWSDINIVGWASAVRPGAMGSFASICVTSISCEKLEAIKADRLATENKKAVAEKAEIDRVAAIFDTAKATGEKQELKRYMTDCNDPHEECSTDVVTVWAMPDGSEKTTRMHTW